MAAEYNITHDKGTTFKLFALYKDSAGSAIDLANFTARMQVRKSPDDTDVLLFMTGTTMSGTAGIVHSGSVTGGGSTGEFTVGATSAQTGTGDIRLNAGSTGFTGETGGVYLEFDAVTSANLPTGRHFYDLELIEGTEVTRLVQGRFKTNEEITR